MKISVPIAIILVGILFTIAAAGASIFSRLHVLKAQLPTCLSQAESLRSYGLSQQKVNEAVSLMLQSGNCALIQPGE